VSETTAAQRVLVEWQDPRSTWAAGRSMTGLEFLRALVDGTMPAAPIAALMDFSAASADEGRVVFRGQPGERHFNPVGSVHGGFAATLLDSALGCAVHTTLPAGVGYTTVDLTCTFVAPIDPATGPVRCEATVEHRGQRIATATARVTREHDGKLLAHGTTTCLLFPLPPPPAPARDPQ
jgi:uncharacterized protein (TIGR00369 family)